MKNAIGLVIAAVILTTPSSFAAATYHRLYQGYKLESVAPAKYEQIINEKFLPLFPKAHPQGLNAYRPALPKGEGLPAEVALLSFEDEKVYGHYRESELGKEIRDAHTLVFDGKTSKSLVPEKFQDIVELEHAYDLNEGFKEYETAHSAVIIHSSAKVSPADLAAALAEVYKKGSQARNIIFAIAPQQLIEYVFVNAASDMNRIYKERAARLAPFFKNSQLVRLKKAKIGSFRVKAGQGVDAQW